MASKVLLFGSGSIGTVYAYLIAKAIGEENVVCVCRSNYDAATKNGFHIDSNVFGSGLHFKPKIVRSVTEAASYGPYKYVIVAVKVIPTTPSCPEQLLPAISGPETAIVLLQNGIAIESGFQKVFPRNPILSTVVYFPVTQTSPAVFVHRGAQNLHIGTYPSNAPASHKSIAKEFVELVKAGGGATHYHEDIQRQRWLKLLVNATWSPLCTLSRSRDAAYIRASPYSLEYAREIMLEVLSIAQAEGYKDILTEAVDQEIESAKGKALPGNEPSMLADVLAGRQLEVDAIIGNAVDIAVKHGLRTPILRGILAQLTALNESLKSKI